MTYRKFNATAPLRGHHVPRAAIAVAALAGCLAVGHPAPAFAQEEPEAAPARININLLRALGLGQPDDAAPTDGNSQRIASAAPLAVAPPQGAILYRVAPGDTLASIARRIEGASVDWRGLCAINAGRIADCDALRAGDVIVIPDGGRIGAARVTPRADNDAAAPSARVAAAWAPCPSTARGHDCGSPLGYLGAIVAAASHHPEFGAEFRALMAAHLSAKAVGA